MADDFLSKLRADNALLINQLKNGVSNLHLILDKEKENILSGQKMRNGNLRERVHARSKLDFQAGARPSTGLNGNVSVPANNQLKNSVGRKDKRKKIGVSDKAVTSTPMVSKRVLESEGNLRHNQFEHSKGRGETQLDRNMKNQPSATRKRPKSILVTPDKRKVKRGRKYIL